MTGAIDVPKDHALDYQPATGTDLDAAIRISHVRLTADGISSETPAYS